MDSVAYEKDRTVFISYSSEDQELCRGFADLLAKAGLKVWDSTLIRKGDDWREAVWKNLKNCDVVVMLITPNSKDSHWITSEGAFSLGKDKKVIPVLFEGAEPNGPFMDLQWANFPTDLMATDTAIKMNALIEEIKTTLIPPPLTDPIPEIVEPMIDSAIIWDSDHLLSFVIRYIKLHHEAPEADKMWRMLASPPGHKEFCEKVGYLIKQELLSSKSSKIDSEYNAFEAYTLRCAMGRLLAQIGDDRNFLELTPWIEVVDSARKYEIKAMKYHVTNSLFTTYLGASNRSPRYNDVNMPWCLSNLRRETLEAFSEKLDDFVREANESWKDNGESKLTKRDTVRLPTCTEWQVIAKPQSEKWKVDAIKSSNLDLGLWEKERLTLGAVGIFRGGKSERDCYDVLGNAWEICTTDKANWQDPSGWRVLGFDYGTGRHSVTEWRRPRTLTGFEEFETGHPTPPPAVSFRLIVEKNDKPK